MWPTAKAAAAEHGLIGVPKPRQDQSVHRLAARTQKNTTRLNTQTEIGLVRSK